MTHAMASGLKLPRWQKALERLRPTQVSCRYSLGDSMPELSQTGHSGWIQVQIRSITQVILLISSFTWPTSCANLELASLCQLLE